MFEFDNAKMGPPGRGAVSVSGKGVVVLGNEFSHFLPELSRRLAGLLLKYAGEIGLFAITELEAYLRNGLVGTDEKVFGFDQFTGLDDLRNTLLQDALTDQVEIARRHK